MACYCPALLLPCPPTALPYCAIQLQVDWLNSIQSLACLLVPKYLSLLSCALLHSFLPCASPPTPPRLHSPTPPTPSSHSHHEPPRSCCAAQRRASQRHALLPTPALHHRLPQQPHVLQLAGRQVPRQLGRSDPNRVVQRQDPARANHHHAKLRRFDDGAPNTARQLASEHSVQLRRLLGRSLYSSRVVDGQ
jgi:hypothetical protein